jgi:hypothetical protein
MTPPSLRLGNALVMTPEYCAQYPHTRALPAYCSSIFELNFIETFKRLGIAKTLEMIARIVSEKKIDVFFISFYTDSYLIPLEFLLALKKNIRIVLVCNDDESAFGPPLHALSHSW